MPKQLYKITQFHGGLNSNSDARDIAENELSEATDVMVDELGKIRLTGGEATHGEAPANTADIEPGYGLFQFSHDRTEGEDAGDDSPETGDDYLAMADADGGAEIDIYSRVANTWGTGKIDLGSTTGMKAAFYASDGAIRVSDGNFGAANESKWYGYISRKYFQDGTSGLAAGSSDARHLFNKWHTDEAAPKALAVNGWATRIESNVYGTAASPIAVKVINDVSAHGGDPGTEGLSAGHDSFNAIVTFDGTAETITFVASGSSVTNPGIDNFCSIGDILLFTAAAAAYNRVPMEVINIDAGSTNVITVAPPPWVGTIANSTSDTVVVHNLSRQGWFDGMDTTNYQWQLGVSTLYDDSKQESPLSISGTTKEPYDFCGDLLGERGMSKLKFGVYCFAGGSSSEGLAVSHPRVSGFNVYMRREDSGTWYQQANIDITKGIKMANEETYTMWDDAGYVSSDNAFVESSSQLYSPLKIITYEDSAGISGESIVAAFDGTGTGFKTAVVANRRAYVGNFKAKDSSGNAQVYGDAIMKSQVNKFDSFSLDRRLEAEIRDGDSIVRLEEYADRLLQFKKNKMTLINISQEVEFVEDSFMHKGISHPAAACKTDFGIAWVNKQGCYLYDGQKVNNLLEKGGRQIIKESDWATFTTNEPMIGYIPKKRQLLVVDDNTATGTGKTFLYDLATQSWVKGADATITSNELTNFVTDWNGDLIYAHTDNTGAVVKWDDAADSSAAVDIQTKDIDFGQPAQTKKIYKFYITHMGGASNIQLSYSINGNSGTFDNAGSTLPASSPTTDWVTTAITPTTFSCKSLRLRLFSSGGDTPANFEINDITIVYRVKGQR